MATGCGGRSALLAHEPAAGKTADADVQGGWIRGTGTEQNDIGNGIAVDKQGNVVIVGTTQGALAGAALGAEDAFVRRLDARGEVLWTRQFGTEREDQALAVALDGDGGIFVVGHTGGSLVGTSNGEVDAFVRKYDRDGGVAWTRQFGGADWDRALAVAVDVDGHATVAGVTNDASLESRPLLRTYAPNGELVRSHDLDLPGTVAYAVAVDASGSIYLAGSSSSELEGPGAGGIDAILMKLDTEGHVAWTRQYGTTDTDEALAVTIDGGGNLWMAGYKGARSAGNVPPAGAGFLRSYDSRGTLVFSHSIDGSWWTGATGVAVDGRGHGFVLGNRTISDPIRSYASDAYLEELDAEGTLLGPLQLGDAPNQAHAGGVAANASGRVYVLINACFSPFGGHPVVGACDAFVAQVR
jgi:hypothetical protein